MSDCGCQKNINKSINDGSTVDATAAKKPNGDGPLIATIGVRQHDALLASTSLVYLLSFFWSDDKKTLYNE